MDHSRARASQGVLGRPAQVLSYVDLPTLVLVERIEALAQLLVGELFLLALLATTHKGAELAKVELAVAVRIRRVALQRMGCLLQHLAAHCEELGPLAKGEAGRVLLALERGERVHQYDCHALARILVPLETRVPMETAELIRVGAHEQNVHLDSVRQLPLGQRRDLLLCTRLVGAAAGEIPRAPVERRALVHFIRHAGEEEISRADQSVVTGKLVEGPVQLRHFLYLRDYLGGLGARLVLLQRIRAMRLRKLLERFRVLERHLEPAGGEVGLDSLNLSREARRGVHPGEPRAAKYLRTLDEHTLEVELMGLRQLLLLTLEAITDGLCEAAEHVAARPLEGGELAFSGLESSGAGRDAVSTCMQGRPSVAINVP